MFKIINYSIISLIFIISGISFAQSAQFQDDSTKYTDSTAIYESSTYKLKMNPFLNSNKLFLGQKDFEIITHEYPSSQQLDYEDNSPQSLQELKLQLQDYLSQRRNLLPNYDLGDFGKYLGYANTLAAVILAIAHISKYGFK